MSGSSTWGHVQLARFGAWTAAGFFIAHFVGMAMTRVLALRVGFWPVWFLDCMACSDPSISIPYTTPIVGGISIPAIVLVLVAVGILGVRSKLPRSLLVLGAGAAVVHTSVTWAVRYPGSWPPVLAGVAAPTTAAVLFSMALVAPETASTRFHDEKHRPLEPIAWALLSVGVGSLVVLGGVASLGVVASGHVALRKVHTNKSVAVAGLLLGYLGVLARVMLHLRFPNQVGWL